MKLRLWRHVVTPWEDLREGKSLGAAKFAVHLDKVRDGDAPEVYTNPEKSIQVSDRPALTLVVADHQQTMETEKEILALVEGIVRESESSNRTFKSALIWMVADSARVMREEATKSLAWEYAVTFDTTSLIDFPLVPLRTSLEIVVF